MVLLFTRFVSNVSRSYTPQTKINSLGLLGIKYLHDTETFHKILKWIETTAYYLVLVKFTMTVKSVSIDDGDYNVGYRPIPPDLAFDMENKTAYEIKMEECMSEFALCQRTVSQRKYPVCGENDMLVKKNFESYCELLYEVCKRYKSWRYVKEGTCDDSENQNPTEDLNVFVIQPEGDAGNQNDNQNPKPTSDAMIDPLEEPSVTPQIARNQLEPFSSIFVHRRIPTKSKVPVKTMGT